MMLPLTLDLSGMTVSEKAQALGNVIEALADINVTEMRRRQMPGLYASGVTYRHGIGWKDALTVLRDGAGDCKDLVAYRLAELRLAGKAPSVHVVFYSLDDTDLFHFQVKCDGKVEDPSVRLGMRRVG